MKTTKQPKTENNKWKVTRYGDGQYSIHKGSGYEERELSEYEDMRNAKLIEAAPDLLFACQKALELLKILPKESQAPHTIDILESAIQKADLPTNHS